VREKEGLSYSTYTVQRRQLDAAAASACRHYAPQNRERVERAIREELERALAQGFTDAEVEAAKKGLLEARRVQRGQDSALACAAVELPVLGRTFAWDVESREAHRGADARRGARRLRRHIDPKKLSVLKAGDFK
jgi:zinc protease